MNDGSWSLAEILSYWKIALPMDRLAEGEGHLKAHRHHEAWSLELGRDHPTHSFHRQLSQAHLCHLLRIVYRLADFSRVIHSDDDGRGMLCCRDSWSPSKHSFSGPGCAFALLDLDRQHPPGRAHPGDRLLKNMEQAQTFWEWYDKKYGLELELSDEVL